jgi:hypothetical protein
MPALDHNLNNWSSYFHVTPNLFPMRQQCVVPLAVEVSALEIQCRQFGIGDVDTGGVMISVERRANLQPGLRGPATRNQRGS